MAGLILPQGWQRPGLGKLSAVLGGSEGTTRLVGGAVRDTLAGLRVKDIDFATKLPPQDVLSRLTEAGIKSVPTGIAHGTITAILGATTVEITTLRRDVSTDGRRATVAFSDDWQEDAARRDFTVNALYADLQSGEVFDYAGGVTDLEAGCVRFIGDPLTRIAEDHLRILRFFRFQARFGTGAPEPTALAACTARANDLMALSRERIADEVLKLLELPAPQATIALMLDQQIFRPVLPEIGPEAHHALARVVEREAAQGVSADPLRRLAALLPPDPPSVEAVATRLKLSNKARKRLDRASRRRPDDANDPRALAYWEGVEVATDRLLLGSGDVSALADWQPPTFPLTGKHIIARGVAAGPDVARLLKEEEAAWVSAGFPPVPETDKER